MHFEPNKFYHIHNLGINRQPVFFSKHNYHFFLRKARREWRPYAEFIAFSLLPTQFHFIIRPNLAGCLHLRIQEQTVALQQLSLSIGHTLSSYALAVNKRIDRTGCLFNKKTRCTELQFSMSSRVDKNDLFFRIKQLHAKPVEHGLCSIETDWEFSSAREYAGMIGFRMCRQDLIRSVHQIPT